MGSHAARWSMGAVFMVAALLQPAGAAWESAVGTGAAAAVPAGYEQVGHRATGWELSQPYSAAQHGHETVMFTAEGGVFRKKHDSPAATPRHLLAIGDMQRRRLLGTTSGGSGGSSGSSGSSGGSSSASLNPNLSCDGCPDTDVRVLINDTTVTPWSALGLLAQRQATSIVSGIAQCSGTLIGPQRQHVLSAGHCIVDSSTGSDNVNKITFYPGLNGTNDLPFGTSSAVKARVLRQYISEQAVSALALNYDFSLITLSEPAPANASFLDVAAGTGTMTFDLTTAGYPADKGDGLSMYGVNCSSVKFDFTNGANEILDCGGNCDNIVVHDCLSYEGQSGSAIWSRDGDTRTVRAILTGALQESDGTNYNVATQLNSFVYNTIVGWYDEDIADGLVAQANDASSPTNSSSPAAGPSPSSSASSPTPAAPTSPSSPAAAPSPSSSASSPTPAPTTSSPTPAAPAPAPQGGQRASTVGTAAVIAVVAAAAGTMLIGTW